MIQLDITHKLASHKILYISAYTGFLDTIHVHGLTSAIERNYDSLSNQYLGEAKHIAKSLPASDAVWVFKRKHLVHRHHSRVCRGRWGN